MPQATIIKYLVSGIIGLGIIIAAFFYGLHLGKLDGQKQIDELNTKLITQQDQYEKELSEKKVQIVTQYVDRWHTIKENHDENSNIIQNNVPAGNILSLGFVYTHNSAASNTKADRTAAANAAPSGIRDNQALATINDNYAQYYQCVNQVNALLDLIDAHNKTIDDINKGFKK